MPRPFLSSLKRLDLYRDIPEDLAKKTLAGASVSIVAICFSLFLFGSEFMSFMSVKVATETFVDAPALHEGAGVEEAREISINMNITLYQVPCTLLSVDVQDIMGNHVVDVHGSLEHQRVDSKGALKLTPDGEPLPLDEENFAAQKGEGCRVTGFLKVQKVPGNFHVSCHGHADRMRYFLRSMGELNVSHRVNHLSFGELGGQAQQLVPEALGATPLDGATRISLSEDEDEEEADDDEDDDHHHRSRYSSSDSVSYEYYIRIVPTKFEDEHGRAHQIYQFVSNFAVARGQYRIPAIYFRYDFSPITVKFRRYYTPFAHFLVQLCAIIGGVFTVLGLFNSICLGTLQRLMKKAGQGKLG